MESKKLQTNAQSLKGRVRVPGDKSISHRSLMLGSIAEGETVVTGLLRADDCLATMKIMRQLGVEIIDDGETITIKGQGIDGFKGTEEDLDAGNSGTTIRLLSGLLAGRDFESVLVGDESLSNRPMGRIIKPLTLMGADISGYDGGECAPLTIKPVEGGLKAITYESPVDSAQVKSAILLAGLQADGKTTVIEKNKSRNHTEEMLKLFGVEVEETENSASVVGGQKLTGCKVNVPGDISSAAFLLVAGAIVPGSDLYLENVGVNQTRTGILDVLEAMGADMTIEETGFNAANIRIRTSNLKGTVIEGSIIPRLIDELPVIALLATQAQGQTIIKDAHELRVKETDRIQATVDMLEAMGADIKGTDDGMIINGPTPLHGAKVTSSGDHRMGMMAQIAALIVEEGEVELIDPDCINISFPTFFEIIDEITEKVN